MTDPGYLGDDEGTWQRVVSTALTLSGYVVFLGALVAIMTRWLIARMLEFERGLTPVSMRNHIVVIGWTNRTIPLLREVLGDGNRRRRFLAAFGMRRLRAVVLSEEVSALQFQALKADPVNGRGQARSIVLRYGSLLEEAAIRRAACLNAAAVIMPSDYGHGSDLVSPDVETIRARSCWVFCAHAKQAIRQCSMRPRTHGSTAKTCSYFWRARRVTPSLPARLARRRWRWHRDRPLNRARPPTAAIAF